MPKERRGDEWMVYVQCANGKLSLIPFWLKYTRLRFVDWFSVFVDSGNVKLCDSILSDRAAPS
jgi:hypothetical protein